MSRLSIPKGSRRVAEFAGGWTLYELRPREDDSPLWPQFKVMLPPGTPGRWGHIRQFYVRWNPVEQRFRRDATRVALETREPDLYLRLETHMSLAYTRGWLESQQGMDGAEIAAERERLRAGRGRA